MTADESPTAPAPGEPTRRQSGARNLPSRRRFLAALTSGGTVALAGCSVFGSGGGTRSGGTSTSPGSAASGQTLRVPIDQNPAKTSFYATHLLATRLRSTFATIVKEIPPVRFQRFIKEPGVWADSRWAGGNVHTNWIAEPIEVSPSEVTVRIRENARWSDGEPITGLDIALDPLYRQLRTGRRPYYAREDSEQPSLVFGAYDDFEIGEKSVTYHSAAGHFDRYWDVTTRTRLAAFNHFTGNPRYLPTHLEPYASYADAVVDAVNRAQAGEIDPWTRTKPWKEGDPDMTSLARKHLGKRTYVKKYSQPENVVSTGAWRLVELDGSEAFVFEPNSHHRNADALGYDRLVFENTPTSRRKQAGLQADRFDYAATGTTPESVVESLPESLETIRIPGGLGTGNELGVNFDHPALGNRQVRAAIMYALDHGTIANNVHPTLAEPVDNPGGDCWDVSNYASQEWIDDTLTTYTQNRERASSLMRSAGYSRDGGAWLDEGGEPIEFSIATTSDTPQWEPTVASQLSQFGIETSVTSLSGNQFTQQLQNGNLNLWSTAVSATNIAPATLVVWFYVPQRHDRHGIYPDSQFDTGSFNDHGTPLPLTEERWSVFTISAPPIGEPDGALREYHPSKLSLFLVSNPPEAEFDRRVRVGLWLANWYLPTIPINRTLQQHFIDDANWRWPTDSRSWENYVAGGPRTIRGIMAGGHPRLDTR